MLPMKTLKRYLEKCDSVLLSKSVSDAKDLQNEILSALSNDISGLKHGLTNYGFVAAFTDGRTKETTIVGDDVDYLKDILTLKNRLQVEIDKISDDLGTEEENVTKGKDMPDKTNKILISHSSKDRPYMEKLVDLLSVLRLPHGSIICSSVPGFGIPNDEDIYEWLKKQFLTCNLHVIYALSNNYYSSSACLNEMGAAWVTRATDSMILLPGFEFKQISGAINPRQIGISIDSNDDELKYRLNGLKDILIKAFSVEPIDATQWERARDRFIKEMREVAIETKEVGTSVDRETNDMVPLPIDGSGNIPVEVAFLLVYAANSNGQIIRVVTLGGTSISAAGKQFMKDNSPRETAIWQEALDTLVSWGWVKASGSKGQIFEVTGTGFKKAEWLKDGMDIDVNKEPIEQLKEYE